MLQIERKIKRYMEITRKIREKEENKEHMLINGDTCRENRSKKESDTKKSYVEIRGDT